MLNWSIEGDLIYPATFGHSMDLRTHLLCELTRYMTLKIAKMGSCRQSLAGLRAHRASYMIDCDVKKEAVVIRYSSAVHN